MPPPDASFHLLARLKVTTQPVVRGISDPEFYRGIANYAMITMGGRMTHFEGVIPESGILDIDHTFQRIPDGESYHNQMKWEGEVSDRMRAQGIAYDEDDDLRIKSHCIVWLFRRRMEMRSNVDTQIDEFKPKFKGERFDRVNDGYENPKDLESPLAIDEEDLKLQVPPGTESPMTPVLRCYLIGAEAIDLAAVCDATIDSSSHGLLMGAEIEGNGEDGKQPPLSFPVHHNFCETYAKCEILGIDRNKVPILRTSNESLRAGLEDYANEEAKAAKEKRPPDHSQRSYMRSALADLPRCNEIVRLQQQLMQFGAIQKLKRGELELSDEMGAAFLSGSTFLQLHGMAACFTDMSSIVRAVAAEIPFRLLLAHARAAMLVNGMTPEEVCRMKPSEPGAHEKLFAVYLSILTCEMMDQRQAGYYSDYCLYGVEEADDIDYKSERQPGPGDMGCEGEAWFYRVYHPAADPQKNVYVKYRLRLTEDQRQVCTGKGLRYGVINDDCETSASFSMAENKTAACLKSHMLRHGFIEDGDSGPHAQSRDASFADLTAELAELSDAEKEKNEKTEVIAQALGLESAAKVTRDDVYLFMAVANILRQFELGMELCIGTANAAAVGAAAQLSGHCYGMCIAYHHIAREWLAMIVEGTRWVLQEQCKRKEDRLMTDEQGNLLNELSTILMEMTKIASVAPKLDAGCGLMRVMRQSGVPESFYKSIYVVGSNVIIQRGGGGSKSVVVGAPVDKVLRMSAGGACEGTDRIRVQYSLVCREIEARCRRRVKPSAIGEAVVRMARETTVPPWSKRHWAKIIGARRDEPTHVHKMEQKRAPDGMVRFAFTHQLYPQIQDKWEEFQRAILDGVSGKRADITGIHLRKILGPSKEMEPVIEDQERKAQIALRMLSRCGIIVERIFMTTGSVVAVCLIKPGDIATAHAACRAWVQAIMETKEMVPKKEGNVTVLVTKDQDE